MNMPRMKTTYFVEIFAEIGANVVNCKAVYDDKLTANGVFKDAVQYARTNATHGVTIVRATGMFECDHKGGRMEIPAASIRAVFMNYHFEPELGESLPGLPPGNFRLG